MQGSLLLLTAPFSSRRLLSIRSWTCRVHCSWRQPLVSMRGCGNALSR